MKPFTSSPLSALTLSQRLERYGFWKRPTLDLSVSRNALLAAKLIAQSPVPKPASKTVDKIVGHPPEPGQLLDMMYNFDPIRRQAPDLWQELLTVEPVPPFNLKQEFILQVLEAKLKTSRKEAMDVLIAVLRFEISHGRFIDGVELLKFVPRQTLSYVLALPALCMVLATGSFALWTPSYLISSGLFIFWSGLAFNLFRIPSYPRACWSPFKQKSKVAQLRSLDQLRLANFIINSFEETESVNLKNYHLHSHYAPNEAEARLAEQGVNAALRDLGISIKLSDQVTNMYADYWSQQNQRWDSVEWKEPDQDPAEIEFYVARKRTAQR